MKPVYNTVWCSFCRALWCDRCYSEEMKITRHEVFDSHKPDTKFTFKHGEEVARVNICPLCLFKDEYGFDFEESKS